MAKKFKVITPSTRFKGTREGVKFKDGVGMTSESIAKILVRDYGYSCPDLEGKAPQQRPIKRVEDFKKKILLDTAKEVLKCDYVDRIHKDELVINILEDLERQALENAEIEATFLAHAESLDKK